MKYLSTLLLILFYFAAETQKPAKPSSGEIYNKIQQLNFVGSALYVAAHPDDENTTLISYLANHRHARTAYLSLTRGDGGQNRIGTDIREKLGLIRTHELLEARKIDGGQQFFSRANDFGYSKNPTETFDIWDREEVMHDVIKVIREFRPDVVINRFDHNVERRNHGHHTGSAILSVEAFDMAADPNAYKDRLGDLPVWQVRRTFFNTGWWFYGSRENFAKADKSDLFTADAGVYYPILGVSNTEISALSRSMHKSQGFGSTGSRGKRIEYMQLIKGDRPSQQDDIFSGINTTWSRITGGSPIGDKIQMVLENFDFAYPEKHFDQMIEIRSMISSIDDTHWKKIKLAEVDNILVGMAGLFVEARTSLHYGLVGEKVDFWCEAINRSSNNIKLKEIVLPNQQVVAVNKLLDNNVSHIESYEITLADDEKISNPYWLEKPGSLGLYEVSNPSDIGQPISESPISVRFVLELNGQILTLDRELVHKHNDPVKGEVYEPFYILPPVSLAFSDPVYIISDDQAKEVSIEVKSFAENVSGSLSIDAPTNWNISPKSVDVMLKAAGEIQTMKFRVQGPKGQASAQFGIEFSSDEYPVMSHNVQEIAYDHIPKQVLITPAAARFERLAITKKGQNILYVKGAGDDVPKNLRQIGYEVSEIEHEDLSSELLDDHDALIIGIRAYNTKPALKIKKDMMLDYVKRGGTMIVQYNTSRGLDGSDIGPYPFKLSRDRVTDEAAEMTFEIPDHEVLNFPNKITHSDFDNWVQERGLYFPNEWDERYAAPLSCADPGEDPMSGGLLITKYGEGHFIYTGYSWFRELPAGVPGAFRLFANLISIGKNNIEKPANDGDK